MSLDQPALVRDVVVVGVDGSEPSKQALRWGAFLARSTGATLQAVNAWQPLVIYDWAGYGMAAVPGDWDPAKAAEKLLGDTLDEVFGDKRPAELQIALPEGSAAKALLEISRGAGMLVVGSRGHGGFAGLLLGSVSTACAEHAGCPVLVVHGTTPPPPALGP